MLGRGGWSGFGIGLGARCARSMSGAGWPLGRFNMQHRILLSVSISSLSPTNLKLLRRLLFSISSTLRCSVWICSMARGKSVVELSTLSSSSPMRRPAQSIEHGFGVFIKAGNSNLFELRGNTCGPFRCIYQLVLNAHLVLLRGLICAACNLSRRTEDIRIVFLLAAWYFVWIYS